MWGEKSLICEKEKIQGFLREWKSPMTYQWSLTGASGLAEWQEEGAPESARVEHRYFVSIPYTRNETCVRVDSCARVADYMICVPAYACIYICSAHMYKKDSSQHHALVLIIVCDSVVSMPRSPASSHYVLGCVPPYRGSIF